MDSVCGPVLGVVTFNDAVLLLTLITKKKCSVHFGNTGSILCASFMQTILIEQLKKFIWKLSPLYRYMEIAVHIDADILIFTNKNKNQISRCIMTFNKVQFEYNVVLISVWVFKNKILKQN